jgi:putative transcriptional regulator
LKVVKGRIDSSVKSRVGVGWFLALVALVSLPVSGQSAGEEPGAGSFLVASRSLIDPNFDQTVILLLDYNEKGAMGLIINRPTEVRLAEMVSDLEGVEDRPETVWVGGPVAHWQMIVLIRSAATLADTEKVLEDVLFTGSREVLEDVLQNETEFRAYAGYAGWGAGQLDHEIDRGSWHVLPGDPEMVFDPTPHELWRELLSRGESQWASLR